MAEGKLSEFAQGLIGSGAQLVSNLVGAGFQGRANRKTLKYQAALNERYLDKQLAYNTPAAQMQRYKDAGLNPNLIYGQGTPGNQSAPLSSPSLDTPDYQSVAKDLVDQTLRGALQATQVQAINAQTEKTVADTALKSMQAQVLAANPSLNPAGYNAIIDSLVATAQSKGLERNLLMQRVNWATNIEEGQNSSNGFRKMDADLKMLEQRFKLGETDQKIKAQILQSKEFQNAILDVQKKWLTDSEITPQHIYQFITMFLMKLM